MNWHGQRARLSATSGFTLIEIIAVIAIMGMVLRSAFLV